MVLFWITVIFDSIETLEFIDSDSFNILKLNVYRFFKIKFLPFYHGAFPNYHIQKHLHQFPNIFQYNQNKDLQIHKSFHIDLEGIHNNIDLMKFQYIQIQENIYLNHIHFFYELLFHIFLHHIHRNTKNLVF